MVKTPHPAKAAKCTKAQIAAFERICIGDDSGISAKMGKVLVEKGLVDCHEDLRSYGGLQLVISRYSVPLNVHARWCQWCAENADDEDSAT